MKYSLSGVNIQPDVKSFSVINFPNKSTLINPLLSQQFSEKLKQKFITETSLVFLQQEGDWDISGTITDYNIAPVTVQNNQTASKNRLTMSVNVVFKSIKHPEDDFTQTFSNFKDFDASVNFQSVETQLSSEISDFIVQDIFNKIALKW